MFANTVTWLLLIFEVGREVQKVTQESMGRRL